LESEESNRAALLILSVMAGSFRRIPFAISWWAYTFPSAAMAVAALEYHLAVGSDWTAAIAAVLLAAATLIILSVTWRTLRALFGGTLY